MMAQVYLDLKSNRLVMETDLFPVTEAEVRMLLSLHPRIDAITADVGGGAIGGALVDLGLAEWSTVSNEVAVQRRSIRLTDAGAKIAAQLRGP